MVKQQPQGRTNQPAKTPALQETDTVTAAVPTTPAPMPAPEPAAGATPDPASQPRARAAQPTPAIAGVTAPAGPSSLTPVAPQQVRKPEPFLSEGMRHDLEEIGWAIDPVSGARFDRDPVSGEVTMRRRLPADAPQVVAANWSEPVPIQVALTPQPATNDTDKAEDLAVNPLVADQPVAQPDKPADRPSVLDTGETLSYNPLTGVTTAHDPQTGEVREVSEEELRAAQANPDGKD